MREVGGGRGGCPTGERLTRQDAEDVGERAPTVNSEAEGRSHGAVVGSGVVRVSTVAAD